MIKYQNIMYVKIIILIDIFLLFGNISLLFHLNYLYNHL